MSNAYSAVQWNPHKKTYDRLLIGGIVSFLVVFIAVSILAHPAPNEIGPFAVVAMRATAVCAFVMLHVILMIGPLARLSPKLAPLLYNRRHFGVAMFSVAFLHGLIAILFYHGMGDENPLVSLFTANVRFDSIAQFPFQILGFVALVILFLMAATSHDFWLKNLGPSTWKALHMLVYLAYALLVMHVALGALQSERDPMYVALLALGVGAVCSSHLIAGTQQWRRDAGGAEDADWILVGNWREIPEDCAKIVNARGGERIAVFRYESQVSAISNVCAHQGGPLGEGRVVDGCVTCPWHGYQYLPDRGQSPPPFTERIATYALKLEGEEVWVDPRPLAPGTPVEPVILQSPQGAKHD